MIINKYKRENMRKNIAHTVCDSECEDAILKQK